MRLTFLKIRTENFEISDPIMVQRRDKIGSEWRPDGFHNTSLGSELSRLRPGGLKKAPSPFFRRPYDRVPFKRGIYRGGYPPQIRPIRTHFFIKNHEKSLYRDLGTICIFLIRKNHEISTSQRVCRWSGALF